MFFIWPFINCDIHIYLVGPICALKIGNSVFFDCSSKKWFPIVAGLQIWAKIEHCFVRPILINFTLQIMGIATRDLDLCDLDRVALILDCLL